MANTVVTMKVRDFDHWHYGYEGHTTDLRNQICDESRTKVYRTAENPNDISITLYESISVPRKNDE